MQQTTAAWLTAALVSAITCITSAHLSHYTWWGILQFYVLCLMNAAGTGERFILAYMFQACLIVFGVAAMSVMGCELLEDAASEWSLLYLPLNFMVHFAPSLVAVAFAPIKKATRPAAQIVLGGLTFVVYATTTDSAHTYGCQVGKGLAPLAVVAATVAMLSPTAIGYATRALVRPIT